LLHKLNDAAKQGGERGALLGGREHLESVPDGASPPQPDGHLLEEDDDPHRLARLYLESLGGSPHLPLLRYWRDEWLRWDGSAYHRVEATELRAQLNLSIKSEFDRIHRQMVAERMAALAAGEQPRGRVPAVAQVCQSLVANVLEALKSLTLVKGTVGMPAWLEGGEHPPASEMLAFRNGLVHLPSFAENRGDVRPCTPAFFSSMALEYDVVQNAQEPRLWLDFLNQLWPKDPASIDTLAEWFGYCLLPDTSQQKILMLVGPPRSGKGTVTRILTSLIGRSNVAGPTLSSLSTNFGLSALIGKQLAITSDARLSGKSDQAVIVERLLSISGEDSLTIDRKNREPLTVRLPTRLMLVSNELPRLSDASGALTSRLIFLATRTSFVGKEDPKLFEKLEGELPGIFLWAVEGLKRLLKRGHFLEPPSSVEIRNEMKELTSPISSFLDEECELDLERHSKSIHCQELYQQWVQWCMNRGIKQSGTSSTFGRDLRAAVPAIQRKQSRQGKFQSWFYLGVALRRVTSGLGYT
jgi:putative DNA primase/helicase